MVEVVEAMAPVSQPELLATDETEVDFFTKSEEKSQTYSIISPVAKTLE